MNLPKLNVPSCLKTAALTTDAPPGTRRDWVSLPRSCEKLLSSLQHALSDGGHAVSQANAYKNNRIIAPFLQCHVIIFLLLKLTDGASQEAQW